MVTENNSQLNSFTKGMNSDSSYSMIQEGQYIYANNLRLFQIDSETQNGQGELRAIEGITVSFSGLTGIKQILAATAIRNIGIVVVKNVDDTWAVYKFKNPIDDQSNASHTYFNAIDKLDCVFESVEQTNSDIFSIVGRYEDEDNMKLYIADGEHPVMLLNINKSYNGKTSIDNICTYPSSYLSAPVYEKCVAGSIKAGLVSYAYRLYAKKGIASTISPHSKLIPTVNTGKGNIGEDAGKNSTCGITVTINIKDNLLNDVFDHIQIYRILYQYAGQEPSIELIADQKLYSSVFDYTDYGSDALSTLSLEEFNSISGINIVPKIIESKEDYMLAANVVTDNTVYENDAVLSWDARSFSFDENGYLHLQQFNDPDNKITNKTPWVLPDNINIYHDCYDPNNDLSKEYEGRFKSEGVYGGIGKNISWEFVKKDLLLDDSVYSESDKIYHDPAYSYKNIENSTKYKSLRRGELYRYGIVLYDKYNNHSDAKWIADIRVPEQYTEGFEAFKNQNLKLYGTSIGIRFTVENLPQNIVGYEIVRCNRTDNDIKTVTQGVISRPITMIDATTVDKMQYKIYPYMPTGYLTTAMWYTQDGDGKDKSGCRHSKDGLNTDLPWKNKLYFHETTNVHSADNYGNKNVLQFVSAETTYVKDTTEQQLDGKSISLRPLRYIYPTVERQYNRDTLKTGNNSYLFTNKDNNTVQQINSSKLRLDDDNASGSARTWYGWNEDKYVFKHGLTDSIEVDNWQSLIQKVYSYSKLYSSKNEVYQYNSSSKQQVKKMEPIKISDTRCATENKWNGWYTRGESNFVETYNDNNTPIGNSTFCNWVLNSFYDADLNNEDAFLKKVNEIILNGSRDDTVIGSGGRCMLLNMDVDQNALPFYYTTLGAITEGNPVTMSSKLSNSESVSIDRNSLVGTYVCNIQQDVIPYGGGSLSNRNLSVYYSYGDYSKNATIDVYDGDCFVTLLEYVSMHKIYSGEGVDHNAMTTCIVYSIPLESNINTSYTNGFEFSRNKTVGGISNIQIEPQMVHSAFVQPEELYRYNTVYGTYDKSNPIISESTEIDYHNDLSTRVYNSEIKSNDENIDSWSIYKSNNYIDVDRRYGELTNIVNFKNTLVFWQEQAVGRISSKERAIVQDKNGLDIVLGNGDILERYDYLDRSRGMHKNQMVTEHSGEILYWFDDHNQSIMCTPDASQIVDLTKNTGNSNNMRKYEKKNGSFKMFLDNKYDEVVSSVLNNKSIVYNQNNKTFTSFVDIPFDESICFNNVQYLLNIDDGQLKVAQWNYCNNIPSGWDGYLYTTIEYVVNKSSQITKVFDNQEIITSNNPKITKDSLEKLNYQWRTDINNSSTNNLQITDREANFRYSIPRQDNAQYGNRIRGKYMICDISGQSNKDLSISYILTKFRISWN